MAVENYEQQVTPDATQAAPPEELHPLSAAFGGDIGKALETGGEQISNRIEQLTQHMSLMNFYRSQQNVADKILQMKNDQDKVLYGPPDDPNATVTKSLSQSPSAELSLSSGGQSPSDTEPAQKTFEVPAGILNRKDSAAAGATQDYHDWYTNYSQQMVQQAQDEGMGERAIRSMKMRMDVDFASNARFIAGHEAQQLNNGQIKTFTGLMQKDADSASLAQDPQSLGLKIDSINKTAVDLSSSQTLYKNPNGTLTDAHIKTANSFVGQALNNSGMASLKLNGGDPTQFQATLDKLHTDGRINDTQYTNAQKQLNTASNAMIKQNNDQAKIQMNTARMNYIGSALQNKLNSASPNALAEIGDKDPQVMTAIEHHLANPHGDVKNEDEDFEAATKTMVDAGSKEQISNYMMKALKEKNISQDKLNVLFDYAMDKGKSSADLEDQPAKTNPVQNLIDQGMKVLFGTNANEAHPTAQTLVDYMKAVKEGKTVPEAIQQAQGQDAVRKNPHLLNIPPNGMIFHDKNGIRRIVYPDLHTESIGGKTATTGESNGSSSSDSND